MKTMIAGGASAYTVTCDDRAVERMKRAITPFTAEMKRRTGAELTLVTYDEKGVPRQIFSPEGARIGMYAESGALSELYYGERGFRLARYDREGVLTEVLDATRSTRKALALLRPDGTIESLLDEKGKPLADCDETGAIVVIRHAASDILTEEDEEYEERRALAEARLPLAEQMLTLARETCAAAEALRETALRNRREGREIAIVPMGDRPVAEATLPMTGYELRFEGETLTVRAYAELLVQKALADLLETVDEGAERWELAEDYQASFTDRRVAIEPPMPDTEKGILRGVYYCGDENFELCFGGVTTEEYKNYIAKLTESGYATYAENKIGDCLFGTYTISDELAGEAVVFTMHYPALDRTQIVYGPRGYLPSTEPAPLPEHPVQTTFTQLGRMRPYLSPTCAPGMCYIIQLADGSYIVIDGGCADKVVYPKVKRKGKWISLPEEMSRDEENLYRFLCDHAPNGEMPRIAIWFMTHPHGDHTELAASFLKNYEGRVKIDLAAFNMPHFESCPALYSPMGEKGCVTPFRERITELYGAETLVMHAGQKLRLPGCELDVLYTQEDYFPEPFASANHMSCAFVMKFATKTVTILGDCEKQLCKAMADSYNAALKCDVVQVTHHGSNGGDVDLYRYMDPAICFWAVDGYRFENSSHMTGTGDGYLYNRYLRDAAIRKRTHYHNDTTVTLEV